MADAAPAPILIAEDDPNDLFLVRRHFKRAGVTQPLQTFANGEELIDFLAAHCLPTDGDGGLRPKLLFLDIKMPRRDGFQTLEWIRRQPALRELKVVILSGSDEPNDVARATALGATRFLTKYPPPEVLAEIVAACA